MKQVKDDESYSKQTHIGNWLTEIIWDQVQERLLKIKTLSQNISDLPLKPK